MTQVQINTEALNPNREHTDPVGIGFPQSILAVSREELSEAQLTVKKGLTDEETQLPQDLTGHVFVIAPAGSVTSVPQGSDPMTALPAKDGWTPLFNGDGMIYRLDLGQGVAQLTTRLIKTPCYYADLATQADEKYKDMRFQDVGITRMAWDSLGVRNQLNTAFITVKSAEDQHERLFATWDVGRPYEIDPVTLDVLTPMGWNHEWRELTSFVKARPFKQVLTAAHPAYDPKTHELFTVNVGKSLSTLMGLSRSASARLEKQRESVQSVFSDSSAPFRGLTKRVTSLFSGALKLMKGIEQVVKLLDHNDFVDLMRWDMSGSHVSERWRVMLPNNRSIRVEETLHQIGLTQDFIVIADTSFKLVLEHFLPYQKSQLAEDAKILLADLLDYPQLDITKLYIVRRADLKPQPSETLPIPTWLRKIFPPSRRTVVATSVELPFEMAHYLVDYDNPGGKITLHGTHNCATDPAENIRIFDRSIYDDRDGRSDYEEAKITSDVQRLAGTVVGPMDISRLAGYIIDPETETVDDSDFAYSMNHTWSTALYASRDCSPTGQFQDIYWSSWGCWPDKLTKRSFEAYESYKPDAAPGMGRIVSVEEVLAMTWKGVPASLCHVQIERNGEAMKQIKLNLKPEKCYSFPPGYLGTSPQFVPRMGSETAETPSTDGYIISVVLHSNCLLPTSETDTSSWSSNSELWIFDAKEISAGPLYRLSHAKLNFGFTLHTTWMQEIASPQPMSDYDIRKDHDPLINEQPKELQKQLRELFETEIYPKFEP